MHPSFPLCCPHRRFSCSTPGYKPLLTLAIWSPPNLRKLQTTLMLWHVFPLASKSPLTTPPAESNTLFPLLHPLFTLLPALLSTLRFLMLHAWLQGASALSLPRVSSWLFHLFCSHLVSFQPPRTLEPWTGGNQSPPSPTPRPLNSTRSNNFSQAYRLAFVMVQQG